MIDFVLNVNVRRNLAGIVHKPAKFSVLRLHPKFQRISCHLSKVSVNIITFNIVIGKHSKDGARNIKNLSGNFKANIKFCLTSK